MEVGGYEELHRFGKWSYKALEKSFIVAGPESSERTHCLIHPLLMSNVTVVFDPYAPAEMHNFVQTIVVNHNVASTGQTEWSPVAFFQRRKAPCIGRFAQRYLGCVVAVKTLAVAMPVRRQGFGKELMKRAETYAIQRGRTDAFLDTFSSGATVLRKAWVPGIWNV